MVINHRLMMFSGKGGVGKTTCASAQALSFALAGHKTLIFSTDPAHSLSDMFRQEIGNLPTPIKTVPLLYAMELNAEEILSEFKEAYKEDIISLLVKVTYLDEGDVASLFRLSFPGLDEVMGLKKICDFLEKDHEFTYYVWDTAPTGHTLRLLALPELFDEWVKVFALMQWRYQEVFSRLNRKSQSGQDDDFLFNMKRMIRKVNKHIVDAEKTQIVPVTIPEGLAVEETKRLNKSLLERGIGMRSLIINQVMPDSADCSFCQARQNLQREYIKQLEKAFFGKKIIKIPAWPGEVKGVEDLKKLTEFFERG